MQSRATDEPAHREIRFVKRGSRRSGFPFLLPPFQSLFGCPLSDGKWNATSEPIKRDDKDTFNSALSCRQTEGYPPDFFDFIVIDECHRGGANDESNWRGILDYFAPPVQLGLTPTPKRKDNIDTYAYFGEPVYFSSLKQCTQAAFPPP